MSPGENATAVPEFGTEILQNWRFAEDGSVSLSEGVWPNGQTGSCRPEPGDEAEARPASGSGLEAPDYIVERFKRPRSSAG